MSSKKKTRENSTSSKVRRSSNSIKSSLPTSSKPLKNQIITRSKMPDLSPVNVIEQISQLLRREIHTLDRKKVSGE